MIRPCSGLGSFSPCERRDTCANYVGWWIDPRSAFNICTITGQAFKHYIPRGVGVYAAAQNKTGQLSLFVAPLHPE